MILFLSHAMFIFRVIPFAKGIFIMHPVQLIMFPLPVEILRYFSQDIINKYNLLQNVGIIFFAINYSVIIIISLVLK